MHSSASGLSFTPSPKENSICFWYPSRGLALIPWTQVPVPPHTVQKGSYLAFLDLQPPHRAGFVHHRRTGQSEALIIRQFQGTSRICVLYSDATLFLLLWPHWIFLTGTVFFITTHVTIYHHDPLLGILPFLRWFRKCRLFHFICLPFLQSFFIVSLYHGADAAYIKFHIPSASFPVPLTHMKFKIYAIF